MLIKLAEEQADKIEKEVMKKIESESFAEDLAQKLNDKYDIPFVKEEKAAYETDADEDDEESINPKKLMTIWEGGFKNKYVKEMDLGGEMVDVINLYPKNAAKVEYHTVILYISKSSNELKKVILKMKDGTVMTYRLTKFESNPTISDSKFVFDKSKYPGYTVIKD